VARYPAGCLRPGVAGYFAYQKVQIDYYQYRLRKAYEDTFYDLPDGSDKFDDIVMTERQPMRLVIPKINVDLIVQVGDVFDMALLDKGPVHFQMSDLPALSQAMWPSRRTAVPAGLLYRSGSASRRRSAFSGCSRLPFYLRDGMEKNCRAGRLERYRFYRLSCFNPADLPSEECPGHPSPYCSSQARVGNAAPLFN